MYATLTFDTEDVYYPPQYHIDDIPGWLARIMTEVGITGTFCVFAEKARSMKDRGRKDVLEAMARHDIASHQKGNVRPLIPEILQDKGWDDGVAAMGQYEDDVAQDLRAAFGKGPVGLSRHNLYWGPQHVAVGGQRHMPYVYGVLNCGQPTPAWYAGTLNLPNVSNPGFGGFDEIYSCDAAFEEKLKALDKAIAEAAAAGAEYFSVFGCHPVRVMARGWIEEYCLVNGLTLAPKDLGWLYSVKPPEDQARAQANFRRLCQYLKDNGDIQVVGLEEAGKLFSAQPADITRDELTRYAERVQQADRPVLDATFSPAEMLAGLVESIAHAAEHGDVPYAVQRRNVLGPKTLPVVGREVDAVSHDQLAELCRQACRTIPDQGHLPANVNTPAGLRVGTGQLLVLAARGFLALARYEKYQTLRLSKTTRYPDAALEIDAFVRRSLGEHWPYGLDFSCDKVAQHARLQTWTLKPAHLRPPRGRPYSEGRISL